MNQAYAQRGEIGKVLLLGGQGMLGQTWQRQLTEEGIDFTAPCRQELDLAKITTSDLPPDVSWIINAAAYTDVDGAESEAEKAHLINASAMKQLARCALAQGAHLLHYSTDYVFSGNSQSPYLPTEPHAPINIYGQSKSQGEKYIVEAWQKMQQPSQSRHLIIRTSWLYAPWGKNFLRTMRKLLMEKTELSVVEDQIGRPTSCKHLVQTSLKFMRAQTSGIYHVTDGGEPCSWFLFATYIKSCLQKDKPDLDCRISPCSSDQFPRPAARPSYSVLNLDKTEKITGPSPAWQSLVSRCIQDILINEKAN